MNAAAHLLAASAFLCLIVTTPSRAQEDRLTWFQNEQNERRIHYGLPESGVVDLSADCDGLTADVYLRYPGEGRRDGQMAQVRISANRASDLATGVLILNEGHDYWLFRTILSVDHPLFQTLKSGRSVRIGQGPNSYTLPAQGARKPIEAWQTACSNPPSNRER
jgi:hypothetical protein